MLVFRGGFQPLKLFRVRLSPRGKPIILPTEPLAKLPRRTSQLVIDGSGSFASGSSGATWVGGYFFSWVGMSAMQAWALEQLMEKRKMRELSERPARLI